MSVDVMQSLLQSIATINQELVFAGLQNVFRY